MHERMHVYVCMTVCMQISERVCAYLHMHVHTVRVCAAFALRHDFVERGASDALDLTEPDPPTKKPGAKASREVILSSKKSIYNS